MLDYSVYNCSTGLRVMLGGYSHKMPVLLEKVLGKLVHAELAEERFTAIKDVVQRVIGHHHRTNQLLSS